MQAQDTLMPIIFLDDVVISEENNGFSIDDFIRYVKKDTTFYMGFKHLRFYSHNYSSQLNIFNKKGRTIGTLKKVGSYYSNGKKAWIVNKSVINEGKIPIKYVLTDILISFLYLSFTNYLRNISEDCDSILKEFKKLQ